MKRKFMGVIGSEVGPTFTSKGFEEPIIGRLIEQKFKMSYGTSSSEGETIYEVARCVKDIIPVPERDMGMRE